MHRVLSSDEDEGEGNAPRPGQAEDRAEPQPNGQKGEGRRVKGQWEEGKTDGASGRLMSQFFVT